MNELYDQLIRQSLQFEYMRGATQIVPSGVISSWHTLPCVCLSHVTGGEWRVEREDTAPYAIHSGQALFLPSGVRRRLTMVSEGTTVARWAHFNLFLCGYLDVCSLVDLPSCFEDSVAQRMGAILADLAEPEEPTNWLSHSLNRKILEFELASLLLGQSQSKYESELRLQQLHRILPALDAIHRNIAEEFTREKLASYVYLSPSRFGSIFKEALGLSPIDYIVKLRMQRAQQMLINTHLLIEQISLQVGYEDAHYFSRLFKGHYGLSPKQYRAMVLKH